MTGGFDPEFASRGDYVALYRGLGWQAVPALHPQDVRDGHSWKRPAIEWREHESVLVSDEQAKAWFENSRARNVGIITGECSGGLWVLDLDTQRNAFAQSFLDALVAMNGGDDFDTPTQKTGGGGLQLFFRSFGGKRAPTGKTAVGVDIRGQGGFVVCPPSMHESGKAYEWVEGREPWRCATQDAPQFVIDAVLKLLAEHGHKTNTERERTERTESPEADRDAFGFRVDGREEYMARMIWARLIDLRRILPEKPEPEESASFCEDAYRTYANTVAARLSGPHDEALEREGRGRTAFAERWNAAMAKWDGAITSEAKAPPRQPKGAVLQGLPKAAPQQSGAKPDEDFGPDLFTVLDIAAIRNLPDPQWLVKGMIIERSLSLIHGVPGAGKSFVALSLALSIASAQPQWWERPIERSGRVAYISSEGVADMRDRIAAFEGYHHLDLTDAGFLLLPDWISFMESEHLSKLARTLDAAVEAGPLALIVVDTVSRVLPGADENLQADMTQFIRACDILRERYQCAVLGIHHSSRQGNLRGSTVLDGAADSILGLERIEGEVRKGRLLAQKIKAAEDGWETPFDLHVVPLDPLKGTQSLAAAPAGGPRATHPPSNESGSGGFSGGHRGPDRGTQSAILRAVQEAFDAGDPWSSFAQSQRQGRYLPALMRRWGISPEEGEELMMRWLADGTLAVEESGQKGKRKGLRVGRAGQSKMAAGSAESNAGQEPPAWG